MLWIAVASIYMGLVHDKAIQHTEETSKKVLGEVFV